MPDPRVTVIIPVYNQDRYLAEAIESVRAQDYSSIEIIVVDDGSTDRSADVARGFEEVRLVRRENGGHGAAINTGFEHARGELLAFVDGDDKWEPDTLGLRVAKFDDDPDLGMSHGMLLEFVSPELEAEGVSFARADGNPLPGIVIGASMIRATWLRRVGPFDEMLVLGSAIDWFGRARELGIRTFLHPEVILHRRVHTENTTLRRSDCMGDYVTLAKRMLDRKRRSGDEV